jgi:hypothetical protein
MEETDYGRGFDPLWSMYEPEPKREYDSLSRTSTMYISTPDRSETKARLLAMLNQSRSGGIPPETTKEKPIMGYNDYDNRDNRSAQDRIDDEVRKAIEEPRIKAEISKRVSLVTALEPLVSGPVGTVFIFTKVFRKNPLLTVALKQAEDKWAVAGDGDYTNDNTYTSASLLTYLTTGPDLAEDIQVATGFAAPQAPASTDASA